MSKRARGSSVTSAAPPPPMLDMNRHLSFVDASLQEILDTVRAHSAWSPNEGFWQKILSGKTALPFRPLMNRTLTFWVTVYHKWQDLKARKRGLETVSAEELKQILAIGGTQIERICAMFDRGAESRTYTGGKIYPREILVSGVLLSALITTDHKFSFFFGLFDTDNSGSLNVHQFTEFLTVYRHGLSAVFSVPSDARPPQEATDLFASDLFAKISKQAASRVRDLISLDVTLLPAVLELVRHRSHPNDTSDTTTQPSSPSSPASKEQSVPYVALEEGCIGDQAEDNPVALLLLMSFRRWCSSRHDVFEDEYGETFRLADAAVKPHRRYAPVEKEALIRTSRPQVLFIKLTFEQVAGLIDDFGIDAPSRSEVREIASRCSECLAVATDFAAKVTNALCNLLKSMGAQSFKQMSLLTCLKSLYPGASPKLLRTFEVWGLEYEQWLADKEESEEAVLTLDRNDAKPLLPPDEASRLRRLFARLDKDNNGIIDAAIFFDHMEMSRSFQNAFLLQDCQDGFIDEHDFMRLMCPQEYRLPLMDRLARDVFAHILAVQAREANKEIQVASGKHDTKKGSAQKKPDVLLPIVGAAQWTQWESLFRKLDRDSNDLVSVRELTASNLFSEPEAKSLVRIFDTDGIGHISKVSFMTSMLKAFNLQVVDPNGLPLQ